MHVSDTTDWKAGTLCYKHDIKQPLNNTVIVDCFTSGRYVTIYNSRNITVVPLLSEFAYINICEINITGNTCSSFKKLQTVVICFLLNILQYMKKKSMYILYFE